MANLENNSDKENKKSITDKVGDSVQKSVENVQKTVKETVKDAANLASDAINHPVETAGEFAQQAAKDVTSYKWWAKLLLVLFWTAISVAALFVIAVNLPVTKNWAAQKVIKMLNEDLHTEIAFDSIDVNYFGDVAIHNVSVKDNRDFPFLKAKEIYADSNWFSIIANSRNLKFQSLSLKNMDLKVITYKGDSISNFIRFIDNFDDGKPVDPKRPPFQMKTRVFITDSKVSIVNQNIEGDAGKWLDARNFNVVIPELLVKGPDVSARLNNARFITERWGKEHVVETFSTDFSLTKKALFLKDLTLNTTHTLLQGDVKFNLNDGKWSDFSNKVKWDMNLKQGSQISGYDISYFVTNWDNYKPVNISGTMTGPLNDFLLENFVITNPQVNIRTDEMKISRILDGNFMINTNSLSTDFTYKDLKAMMPDFIASKMKNYADDFGRLKYNGAVSINPKQVFVQNAKVITGVGQAKISNFYLEDYSSNLPKYRGNAEVNDLNVSAITKSREVGLVSGKFNVRGESFDVNTMKLQTTSEISKIEIMNKTIRNIYLNGLLDRKTYNGIVNVNDENAKAEVKGFIDFRTSRLSADINADVKHLQLNYFTGGKEKQVVSGFADGKISMTNLNDLLLDVNMRNMNFATSAEKFHIKNADLKVFFEDGNRIISVDAPEVMNGKISGKFNLEDLGGMIENGLGKILVGSAPKKLYRNQNFTMNFDIKQDLINYFLPDIYLPNGISANGSYDGNSNNLVLNVDAASIKYVMLRKEELSEAEKFLMETDENYHPDYKIEEKYKISRDSVMAENLLVRINTANSDEQIFAKIGRVQYDQNILKDITLNGNNEDNRILHISAAFKHGTPEDEKAETMRDYAINFNQSASSAGDYVFRFEPTTIKFNDVSWSVDSQLEHSITYRKKEKDFLVENLRIFSDDSELFVKEARFRSGSDFYADAEVKNLDIAKIFALTKSENDMGIEGIANGSIKITKSGDNLEPLLDIGIDDIFMNGKAMGKIVSKITKSEKPNVSDVSIQAFSSDFLGKNTLDVSGTIDYNSSIPILDLNTKMDEFDLAFAQQFVKGIFSNFRGKASGDLAISGKFTDLDYSGEIDLKGFGLKLDFTGVDYSFDDTVISLSRGLAVLNNIGIKDGRPNSGGSISGAIRFETLSSMAVELVMNAENLMVLNTTQKDYDLFWGKVYGKGDLYVSGPVAGLSIETSKEDPFRALNNSIFTFNSNATSNVEEFKMLRFLEKDDEGDVIVESRKKSGANMNVDFTLSVDKGTTVNVLIGDDIGDITVRGNSDKLHFVMGRTGTISMTGNYFVDSGTFISKAILNRKFQIVKGSSIRWDGDAMSPELGINATYLRTVTNAGQYLNMGNLPPINVLLSTKITQTLNNPKIELGVSAQDVSSSLREILAEKMSNEDEKVIQFGSVLVLNSFNVGNSGFTDIDIGKTSENFAYNMAFKQLSSVLNTISNQFQLDLNYLRADAGSTAADRANASMSFMLSPRINIKTGLGIPISKSENADQNYLSGEGIIEYDWSKKNDGTRLLRAYSKPTNIGMTGTAAGNAGANQSYGIGVVYSKSFNTIFKKKEKVDKKEEMKTPEIKRDSIAKDTLK